MKLLHSVVAFGIGLCVSLPASADVIVAFNFENTPPTSSGPGPSSTGFGKYYSFHSGATTYPLLKGNGSDTSYSTTNWAVGDYYQFLAVTKGYQGLHIGWDQTSSDTGPRDFALSYSTDGTNFTTYGSPNSVLVNQASPHGSWNASTYISAYHFNVDLSSITALDNQSLLIGIYFRLTATSSISASGGTISSSGISSIDNFTVSGTAVPEPTSMILAGLLIVGAGGYQAARRRTISA